MEDLRGIRRVRDVEGMEQGNDEELMAECCCSCVGEEVAGSLSFLPESGASSDEEQS